MIFKMCFHSNPTDLIKIFSTVQTNAESCERSFSCLKRFKTYPQVEDYRYKAYTLKYKTREESIVINDFMHRP